MTDEKVVHEFREGTRQVRHANGRNVLFALDPDFGWEQAGSGPHIDELARLAARVEELERDKAGQVLYNALCKSLISRILEAAPETDPMTDIALRLEALIRLAARVQELEKQNNALSQAYSQVTCHDEPQLIMARDAADAEIKRLREAVESLLWQFAFRSPGDPPRLHTGGMSALEEGFDVLGWPDPKKVPEIRCDEPGCVEVANCGWNDSEKRRSTCHAHRGKHVPFKEEE